MATELQHLQTRTFWDLGTTFTHDPLIYIISLKYLSLFFVSAHTISNLTYFPLVWYEATMPSLTNLPQEIQDQIWREVLVYDRPLHCKGAQGNGTTNPLFVSKRLLKTYTPMFWRENIFVVNLNKSVIYMDNSGADNRAKLKKSLEIPPRCRKHIRNMILLVADWEGLPDAMQNKRWMFDLTPNLVYLNININRSWGSLKPMAKFRDF